MDPFLGLSFQVSFRCDKDEQKVRRLLQLTAGSTLTYAGTVASGGGDALLTDANGSVNPDVVYVLQTHDGGNILVREKGHAPNLFLLFETGSDKYDWLNSVVAYGQGSQSQNGVSLNVWQVSVPFECASAFS